MMGRVWEEVRGQNGESGKLLFLFLLPVRYVAGAHTEFKDSGQFCQLPVTATASHNTTYILHVHSQEGLFAS